MSTLYCRFSQHKVLGLQGAACVCASPVLGLLPFTLRHPIGPLASFLGICERQLQAASGHFLTLTLLSVLRQPILHPTPTVETREMGLKKFRPWLNHPRKGGPMLLPSKPGHLPGRFKGTLLSKNCLGSVSGSGDELRGDLDPAGCCGVWQLCVPGRAR